MHALADVPCSVLAVEHLKSISSLFKYARIISYRHYKYGKNYIECLGLSIFVPKL